MPSVESRNKSGHTDTSYIKTRVEMPNRKIEIVIMKKLLVDCSAEFPISNRHNFGDSFFQVGFYNSSFCKRVGM